MYRWPRELRADRACAGSLRYRGCGYTHAGSHGVTGHRAGAVRPARAKPLAESVYPRQSEPDSVLFGLEQLVVAVADRHLGDVRNLADLALGDLLVREQRGGVHRGGGETDR